MSALALRPRLARLPRDTRDTLFLLGVITAVLLPHVDHLPWWSTTLSSLVLLWRGVLAWQQRPLPGRWALLVVFVIAAALTKLNLGAFFGREPGVTMLAVLLALKTLELRARRDAFVVFFLGFFLLLAHFFYSQSLLTALWMLLTVWGLLAAVVLAQMPDTGTEQAMLSVAARRAAHTTLLGLPVMVLLFMFFPRIAPLWGVPTEQIGRTGLSNQLEFGAMNEVANDDAIALRLKVLEGPLPAPDARYFRGPVLSVFDGKTWRAADRPADSWRRQPDSLRTDGRPLRYELTLEPLRILVLPLLEMSDGRERSDADIAFKRGPDLQWLASRPLTERLRLTAEAYPSWTAGLERRWLRTAPELQLPATLNPRSRAWAQALASEPRFATLDAAERTRALVDAVLQHIRTNDFTYTLAPGRYGEDSPHLIDEFWFDRRLGFCEHFASGFVVVMRAMGVPARVVTGFQGWDPEPQDGFLVVRNANAHAWAEVWVPGQGWLRTDPTAAVAPSRVSAGEALRPAPGVLGQLNPTAWRALRGAWEAINNRWAQWVLNYSRQNQFDLLKNLGFQTPDWTALGQATAGVILALTLAAVAWMRWQQRPHGAWARMRLKVQRELQRLGVEAPMHESLAGWAARLEAQCGPTAKDTAELLRQTETARYRDQVDDAAPQRLLMGLRRLPRTTS